MIHIILISTIVVAYINRRHFKLRSLAFLILAFIASIRYMYGNDYSSYYRCYDQIRRGINNPFEEEILYTCLNKIVPSFYLLIAIVSLFFIYVIYKFITNNIDNKYIWLTLFVFLFNPYLFLMNLSAIRQCIAMCFFIIAVRFAIKKKISGYIICIVVAILFHKSAILLAPIIFLVNDKKIDVKKILIIMIGILLLLNYDGLTNLINDLLINLDYTDYYHYVSDETGNSVRATILSSIYFVYVLFNLPKLEGKYLIYGKIYLIATICAVLAFKISMFTRIQMYFDIFSVVIIPYLFMLQPMNGKIKIYSNTCKTVCEAINRYVFPSLIIVIYCLRYYSFFTNSRWESFYQYRTILDLL